MITITPTKKSSFSKASTPTNTEPQSSSSSFGFWSLNSSSIHSPTFLYQKKPKVAAKTTTQLPVTPIIITSSHHVEKQVVKIKKKVSFQTQCQVRTYEVIAISEQFEKTCTDDEEYWEQLGEDYWYQSHDFQLFKKDRRTLVDRIRTIGVAKAKGNYDMEGLEFFLTLQARELHKDRVLDGWVSVLEVQADFEKEQQDQQQQEEMAELIASKYGKVSQDCLEDAHERAVETAQEIQADDDKIVASIPKSPQPTKPSVQKEKVKALVWGNTWSSGSSSNTNNNNNATSFSAFQKIRPFPRQ